jgi:hypothetical protein
LVGIDHRVCGCVVLVEDQVLDAADLAVLQIVDAAAERLPDPDLIRLDCIAGHSAGGAIYCGGTPFQGLASVSVSSHSYRFVYADAWR